MKENVFLLKLNSKGNIKYLERAGYENIQDISYDDLKVKIIVVDEFAKTFAPISNLKTLNFKPLNFEEFKVINDVNNALES